MSKDKQAETKGGPPPKAPKAPKPEKPASPKGGAPAHPPKGERAPREPEPKTVRLLERYRAQVRPALLASGRFKNPMALPRLEKIVVNMGVGKATENKNRIDAAVRDLATITGQQPLTTAARKSVAGFKLREGQTIGCKVTLRGKRMYEFMDRLISVVLPRVRDFRGLSPKSFDRQGNYTLGIAEQIVFPEIEIDKVEFTQGMDVTFVVSTPTPAGSFELLKLLGMPFHD